jgi:predicted phage baseplate assembly protein
MGARAIGGTVSASHSELIVDELLGESDGTPGQRFQLLGMPVLDRREDEYLIVMPPGELPQTWQEVTDFSSSGPEDRHYVIDSITGVLQFGPLVLEPYQLQEETELRARIQTSNTTQAFLATPSLEQQYSFVPPQQYGAVPRRGSILRMSRYRTGGGSFGNVQAETITILKSAVPYVASVTNHLPARNGTDAESLEHAAIKVPQLLRTRDRAVTPEDFELLAIRGGSGAVARAHYLPTTAGQAGTVQLLIVPQANTDTIERGMGIHPDEFTLNHRLEERILDYLSDRKLLGVQVLCSEPEYIGVTVQTEVALKPEYSNPTAKQEILSQLVVILYRFLNPITGGSEGKGWPLGQPVYSSDIAALLQQVPGIRYLGAIQLLELRREGQHWTRLPPAAVINPGSLGVVCSWADSQLRSNHVINIL